MGGFKGSLRRTSSSAGDGKTAERRRAGGPSSGGKPARVRAGRRAAYDTLKSVI